MHRILALAVAFSSITLSSAFAHHPLGGEVPQTLIHGFLSGVGHPVIGFDHFAFVVAIGLIAAFHKQRMILPAGFVLGTMAGTLMTISALVLPFAEVVITASVIVAGVIAMRGKLTSVVPITAGAAVNGLFHGWAYGAAVIGAEATPLIAYLAGFGLVQMAIALFVGYVAANMWKATSAASLQPRLAGALMAGVGVAYMVELVEGLIFPAM
ncbi:MAG: HupE/UreJ family protein [Candidatus Puniceispirillum sp.]|nr:HupE/UreJ family protein [Candidatus Puniceispirillum sp.]